MTHLKHESAAYTETSILTSSRTQQVVMLYEAAIRFLRQAVEAIGKDDMQGKATACDRALGIVGHLHLSLDMERGESISEQLDRLYGFVTAKIVEGSSRLSATELEQAIKVLDILRTGWSELAQQETNTADPKPLPDSRFVKTQLELHG